MKFIAEFINAKMSIASPATKKKIFFVINKEINLSTFPSSEFKLKDIKMLLLFISWPKALIRAYNGITTLASLIFTSI